MVSILLSKHHDYLQRQSQRLSKKKKRKEQRKRKKEKRKEEKESKRATGTNQFRMTSIQKNCIY